MSTDQCLPILVEWADLGRGSGTGLFRPPRASVLKSGGGYGKVRGRSPGENGASLEYDFGFT